MLKNIRLILLIPTILIITKTDVEYYQITYYTNNTQPIVIIKENIEELPIGILEIPKINLTKEFYKYESKNNNINKTIKLLNNEYPNKLNGNLIIASHSGNNYNAYFKNLHKLNVNDFVNIYYDGIEYNYKVTNIYKIKKTGYAHIIRDNSKNTLTLITCIGKNEQLIYIAEK